MTIHGLPSRHDAKQIMRSSRSYVVIGLALCALLVTGCAPVFSDLQSARLAGADRVEVTPSYSSVSFSEDGETEGVQDHFGVQVATGVRDGMDVRIRFERINIKEEDEGTNIFGIGPKFRIVEDRFALNLPVGFAFGGGAETSESFQFHPTALFTLPVHEMAEINASAKALIPIVEREIDDLVALNVGLGLGQDLRRWVVRPEAGLLFNPGEDGHFRHFSIGFTYYFDRDGNSR